MKSINKATNIMRKTAKYDRTRARAWMVNKGNAGLDTFLNKVEEVYGTGIVDCPLNGRIGKTECIQKRRAPFSNANSALVRMFITCRKCAFNDDLQSV